MQQILTNLESAGTDGIVGYLDTTGGRDIVGWVYDKARPGEALMITVLIDGQVAFSTPADVFRPDVISEGYGCSNVGFHIPVPARFCDGSEHSVEFLGSDNACLALCDPSTGLPSRSWRIHFGNTAGLMGSAEMPPVSSSVAVHIDALNEQGLRGWAHDETRPLEPTTLSLFIDGDPVGNIVCDDARLDVKVSGHPSDQVGFSRAIPLRYFDGIAHRVECRSQDDQPVRVVGRNGDHLEFNFPAIAIVGRVDGLHGGALRGWALKRDPDTGRLHGNLQVLVTMQGHPVAQIAARGSRGDVAKAHDCDPNCGFVFHPPVQLVAGRTVEFAFRIIPGGHMLTGSPVSVNFPSLETAAAIRDLQDSTDKIFTELWLLRDRIRRLAPKETYTVEQYDPWAREYQKALAAAPDRLEGLLPASAPPPW